MPNGATANPITVNRALLECGVEAIANQARVSFLIQLIWLFFGLLINVIPKTRFNKTELQ